MQKARVCAIVATCSDGAIGKDGKLPWESVGVTLVSDMKRFKSLTTSDGPTAVVMGRKTWDSLPVKPLKDRANIVVSRGSGVSGRDSHGIARGPSRFPAGSIVHDAKTFREAIECSKPWYSRIFVIGGADAYRECISMVDTIYQTRVNLHVPGCDAFFQRELFAEFDGPFWTTEDPVAFELGTGPNSVTSVKCEFVVWHRRKKLESTAGERQYLELVREVMTMGVGKSDRTGTGTRSVFGRTMRFDLSNGALPLLTTKRMSFKSILAELLWFISGNTSSKTLFAQGVKIWDANGSREALDKLGFTEREEGDLGPVYGFQWRHFGAKYTTHDADYTGQGVDQLAQVVDQLKNNPDSRRILMSAWNPADLKQMALPPCHVSSQFYVSNGKLSCLLYQRSADMGLGVPYNIASYALLVHILAKATGLVAGELVHTMGDCHVYSDHVDALEVQLTRTPKPFPTLVVLGGAIETGLPWIEALCPEDFHLHNYDPHPAIFMKMSV